MKLGTLVGERKRLSRWTCVAGVVMYYVIESVEAEETVGAAAELVEVAAVAFGWIVVVVEP